MRCAGCRGWRVSVAVPHERFIQVGEMRGCLCVGGGEVVVGVSVGWWRWGGGGAAGSWGHETVKRISDASVSRSYSRSCGK